MATSRAGKQKGGALIAVLWFSAALAAVALSVSTSVRSEIDRVSNDSDGLRASYLATGSVDRAVQWMIWGSLYRNPDGTARFWDPINPRMFMHYPSGEVVVEVIPEAAKLDINHATPDSLMSVVGAVTGDVGRARQIVDSILDWRTATAGPSTLDAYYLSLGPTFRPRHASFEEIEELLLVRGMTPELFYGNYVSDAQGRLYARGGLRDCLSVFGSATGPFDVNTASPALLQAMGVAPGIVDLIMRRRTLQAFASMKEVTDLGIPADHLTVGSGGKNAYTLRATARLRAPNGGAGDVVRSAAALIRVIPPPANRRGFPVQVHVLRFYQDAWSEFAVAPPVTAFPPVPTFAPPRLLQ